MRKNTLITNYLAKILEICILTWGYIMGIPLYQTLILLGFFHCGYLVSANIPFMDWPKYFSGFFIIAGLMLLTCGFSSLNFFMLCIGIIITSSFIFQIKDNIKRNYPISPKYKFTLKLIGMISAVIMMSKYHVLLLIIFIAAPLLYAYVKFIKNPEVLLIRRNKTHINLRNRLNWVQFFHHVHYFLFCYTFWALLNNIQPGYFSILFTLGWIAYYIMEKRYHVENKVFNIASIGYGHLFSSITILLMLVFSNNIIILFLWFITGFGGGTIYMLRHFKNNEQFTLFEDWGHTIGCFIAGIAIFFSDSVSFTLILSSISAAIVALISILDNRKVFS